VLTEGLRHSRRLQPGTDQQEWVARMLGRVGVKDSAVVAMRDVIGDKHHQRWNYTFAP